MRLVLIGGGWARSVAADCYGPFLGAAAESTTGEPTVGCLVVDEGDGEQYFGRFADVLTSVAPCRPTPLLVPFGAGFDPALLDGFDALLVCGGSTPAYQAALRPVAEPVREWLAAGRPYAGFSAGAAVAATNAIVGGYRLNGRMVCPPDAAEDLDEISVVPGLGLTRFTVEVHAAQWGTLGRLCAAVGSRRVQSGIAVDEDTGLVIDDHAVAVVGTGAAHVISPAPAGTTWMQTVPAGHVVSFDPASDELSS